MTKDAEQAAAEGPISVGQTTQEAVRKQDQSESTKEVDTFFRLTFKHHIRYFAKVLSLLSTFMKAVLL